MRHTVSRIALKPDEYCKACATQLSTLSPCRHAICEKCTRKLPAFCPICSEFIYYIFSNIVHSPDPVLTFSGQARQLRRVRSNVVGDAPAARRRPQSR